jgi:hypothetical protein
VVGLFILLLSPYTWLGSGKSISTGIILDCILLSLSAFTADLKYWFDNFVNIIKFVKCINNNNNNCMGSSESKESKEEKQKLKE